jgi:mono/diheme cytochrome c family protein
VPRARRPAAVRRVAEEEKPYKVVDGKVDRETFNGYRRYGNSCLQCHGRTGRAALTRRT